MMTGRVSYNRMNSTLTMDEVFGQDVLVEHAMNHHG
jgi:hypothetical protein